MSTMLGVYPNDVQVSNVATYEHHSSSVPSSLPPPAPPPPPSPPPPSLVEGRRLQTATSRFYSIKFTENRNSAKTWMKLGEIQFFDSMGAQITPTSGAYCTGDGGCSGSSYPLSNAYDGSTSGSGWVDECFDADSDPSTTSDRETHVVFTFSSAVTVWHYQFYRGTQYNSGRDPISWTMYQNPNSSPDCSGGTSIASVTNFNAPTGQYDVYQSDNFATSLIPSPSPPPNPPLSPPPFAPPPGCGMSWSDATTICYLEYHADLRNVLCTDPSSIGTCDLNQARCHYLQSGQSEGRLFSCAPPPSPPPPLAPPLAPPPLPQTPPTPPPALTAWANPPGDGCSGNNDLEVHQQSETTASCAALCEALASCISFELSTDGTCQLSSTCNTQHADYDSAASSSWVFFVRRTATSSTPGYSQVSSYGCSGRNEHGVFDGENAATCAARCDAIATCISFEFATGGYDQNRCQLSSSCDAQNYASFDSDWDIYLRNESPPPLPLPPSSPPSPPSTLPSSPPPSMRTIQTACNDGRGGFVNVLDRHTLQVADTEVMTGWSVGWDGCQSNYFRFEYTALTVLGSAAEHGADTTQYSGCNDLGEVGIDYLDRHM